LLNPTLSQCARIARVCSTPIEAAQGVDAWQ
jgi:hypothetical protein